VGAVFRAANLTRKRNIRQCHLMTCSRAQAAGSRGMSRQLGFFLRNTNPCSSFGHRRNAIPQTRDVAFTQHPRAGLCLSCLHRKGTWTRISVIPAIVSSGDCVIAWHKGFVDGQVSVSSSPAWIFLSALVSSWAVLHSTNLV